MKILGWILTIIGGILCFGGVVMMTKGQDVVIGSWIIAIIVLVLGLVILNYKKK